MVHARRAIASGTMAFDNGIADFRSDTVTQPTPQMRSAMAEAEVGDDVYGDDPTVNRLEATAAEVMGFEGAVFVPSGTMANQLAIMAQTRPGDEVICHPMAHVRNIERGASSAFSGVAYRPVGDDSTQITAEHIDEVMVLAGSFFPRVRLACWENTLNLAGGSVLSRVETARGFAAADRHGLAKHVDGARIFNAAVALQMDAGDLVAGATSASICLSKGLGAPVGSVALANTDLTDEIRYLRGRMGGGMRQAGVLAAAALVALQDRDRLAEDHKLAQYLATALADRDTELVQPSEVATNIINVNISALRRSWGEVAADLKRESLLVNAPFGSRFRLVTHRNVDRKDVDRLVAAIVG